MKGVRGLVLGGLSSIAGVVSVLRRYVSRHRVYHLLKQITLYDRTQGSPSLVEAVESVEQYIIDNAPDNVETELILYTAKAAPDWLSVPVQWSPVSAVVEVGDRVYRLQDHPTLVAPHSPPSDGWIEGRVVEPEDPLDPSSYRKGCIYLVTDHHRVAYRLAAEAGAAAVILARKDGDPHGVPYIGLFLDRDEASKYTTPAVALPWVEAENLSGKTVRLRVDTNMGGQPRFPVLAAWLGDRGGTGPVITGHICHYRPGANDNASGASSAVEAFIALAEAIESGVLPEPDATIRLVLVPEYTGTIMSLEGWLQGKASSAINLDMVGGAEHAGVGPAHIYYPPASAPRHMQADVLFWVSQLGGLGIGLRRYLYGSDHDVYLAYGVESEIVNQWPDPHYHSDLDDADKIDPDRLRSAAHLAAAATYAMARGLRAPTVAGRIVDEVVSNHIRNGDAVAAGLARYYLPLAYGLRPEGSPPEWRPPGGDSILRLAGGRRLVFVLARSLSLEAQIELNKALERAEGLPREAVFGDLAFISRKGLTEAAYLTLVAAQYGTRAAREASSVIGILERFGIVEKV